MKLLCLFFLLTGSALGLGAQNLIANPSFEDGSMQIRCDGWFNSCGEELTIDCDSNLHCQVGFHNRSASAIPEEQWSLKLHAGFLGEGYAEAYILPPAGTHILHASFYMHSPGWQGGGYLGVLKHDTLVDPISVRDTSSFWRKYTLVDTLQVQAGDTIALRLTAGVGDFCICTSYFDLVEVTSSTISSTVLPEPEATVNAAPNPASLRLFLPGLNVGEQVILYDISGRSVLKETYVANGLDIAHLSSGLYVFRATTDHGMVAGSVQVQHAD